MKVILKEAIKKLGNVGDEVEVAAGYARNFLIPKGMALEASPKNLKVFQEYRRSQARKLEKEKQKAEAIAKKLASISCTIVMQAHDEQLYGTVTNADVAKALEQEGVSIDKKNIVLEEPIKTLGVYQIMVKLHPDVKQQVKVWVVKK